MINKVYALIKRYKELEDAMSQPDFASNQKRMIDISREHSEIGGKMPKFLEYKAMIEGLEEANEIIANETDADLLEMAKEEMLEIKQNLPDMEEEVRLLLVPKDPSDHKNAVLEIRAGAGGTEAGLFAGDLLRMYEYYAEQKKWSIEVMSSTYGEQDAIKEIIMLVKGENAYGTLKYESGVHRVQRVPKTESQGRVHTSAASVAVLIEADEVEVTINQADLRIDVYRSSGPGGQSVNTTDSAVRIVHVPTGIQVACQDEKSQIKNKAKALRILQTRVYDYELQKKNDAESAERKNMVGSGDRSAKIRTYNFPQSRVTDHRIGYTSHQLEQVLNGSLQEFSDALAQEEMQQRIAASIDDVK